MCIILVNYFRAGDVRRFAPTVGTLQPTDEYSWPDSDGFFAHQDGSLFCLYRCEQKLQLFIDGTKVPLDNDLKTEISIHEHETCFRLWDGKTKIYEKTYPRKIETDGNPYWPSEAEDEDILIWIHNIVESKDRQSILLDCTK